VTINLAFTAAYTTNYAYMVIVVGYQTENNWIDIVNIERLESPTHNNTNAVSGNRVLNYIYGYPAVTTRLTLGTTWKAIRFISSF
jgi:hypothetical protein